MNHPGLFVGLIPDKNRTWTKEHFRTDKPTLEQYLEGYFKGSERVKAVITASREMCFGIIAPWGLSTDNMDNRDPKEKEILYFVFDHYLKDLRDNFMHRPENKNVRFVHMGRRDRLGEEAPKIVELIDEITNDTRERTGMVVAVALDYGGLDEQDRALKLWLDAGCPNGIEGIKNFLDLPQQGIDFRPVDLIVRTGHKSGTPTRSNEYLYPYLKETRVINRLEFLPDYTKDMFHDDLTTFGDESQNRGS